MIDRSLKLDIYYDNDGAFTDYSVEAVDFSRDTFTINFTGTDYLYIGYSKPINTVFAFLSSADSGPNSLVGEYWNGSAWTSLVGFHDESDGFTRNGFISWDRNQTDEAETTVNSKEQYWIRITNSDSDVTATFQALNILFSDDSDLQREVFDISEYYYSGKSDFILDHVSARDEIMQGLKMKDYRKLRKSDNVRVEINAFDILNVIQLRQASTYLVLAKIFMNASDAFEDVYFQKSVHYKGLYGQIISNYTIPVDLDDDGKEDNFETQYVQTGNIKRL